MGVRIACADPGEFTLPYIEVVTLGPSARQRVQVTSSRMLEVYTHWIGGRTLPCVDDGCAGCGAHLPAKHEGFIGVRFSSTKRHQILRLTKPAILQLKSAVGHAADLRGLVIDLERKGSKPNGRVLITVLPDRVLSADMPPDLDLWGHLNSVWRLDGLEVLTDDRAYVAQLELFMAEAAAKNGSKNNDECKQLASSTAATGDQPDSLERGQKSG